MQVSHQPAAVAFRACLNTAHPCLLFTENPQQGAGWLCGQASERVDMWMLDSLWLSLLAEKTDLNFEIQSWGSLNRPTVTLTLEVSVNGSLGVGVGGVISQNDSD